MAEEKRTDEEVLENAPITIEIAGREFQFKEPGRRAARRLLKVPAEINERFDGVNPIEFFKRHPGKALAFADDALDFLYDAIPDMAADSEYLDDNATESEIGEVYAQVVEVLMRPFTSKAEGNPVATV